MKSCAAERRQTAMAYAFLLPTLLVLGLFHFFPMLQAFGISLMQYTPGSPRNEFIGLENFRRLMGDAAFWTALKNTVLYLACVPVIIALSLALALLVEPQIPFIGFFRACYYVPVVTMMVVVAYAWSLIFNTDYGMLNQLLVGSGLVSSGVPWLTSPKMALWSIMSVTIWKGLGYYMVLFLVALKTVPRELVEAARIDGAKRWQVFRNVTLPSVWPIVTLSSVISAIAALKVFEEIYMMTRGRADTATLVYEIYQTGIDMERGSGLEMGYASAMGVVLFVLVLAISAFSIRTMDRMYSS
ncbi:MAG: sugar ABC transporter permease [Candidatus Sumerlaeia bacterium]|nr:sugar ABC transporter permease [Candidatus Sumerlaeia bacterium]